MIKVLINGIIGLLMKIVQLVLTPLNLIISTLFPDMSNAITTFNTFVSTYVGGSLSYFFSLFPPIFRSLLILWFTFVIAYYGVVYTYIAVNKLWTIIQKLKIW